MALFAVSASPRGTRDGLVICSRSCCPGAERECAPGHSGRAASFPFSDRAGQHAMHVYLPIAEMSVSVIVYLALGATVGFLSGLFGVGGGFLLTPLLTFLGVPPAVAVATSTSHVVASSVSGAMTHYRRGNVDMKMGLAMLAGGLAGTYIGVDVVRLLRSTGLFELTVSLTYVIFLGVVGTIILVEGINTRRRYMAGIPPRKSGQHGWIEGLPFKMRFPRSNST